VLIVRAISPGVVRYYLDRDQPGAWTPAAGRLLELSGLVDEVRLRAVLEGRDPESGAPLQPRPPRRRRAGWDLIFAAPKSVSLRWAMGGPRGEAFARAHREAVESVVKRVEASLRVWARSTTAGGGRAEGLIGAAFHHGANAAGEPHLHTHLLVANLSRSGRTWSAVDSAPWAVERAALSALYQLSLRDQLERAGMAEPWRLRPDGLADLAGIPRAAIRSASTQGRLTAGLGRFEARRQAQPTGWRPPVGRAGLDPPGGRRPEADAQAGVDAAGVGPPSPSLGRLDPGPGSDLERRVAGLLTLRRSDFRRADVLVALAACHPGGMDPVRAESWVDRFCEGCLPVASATSGRRWSTAAARQIDQRLFEALAARGAEVGSDPLAAVAGGSWLVLSGPPGRSSLLAHAELLATARRAWDGAGRTVAIDTADRLAAERWETLTGISARHPARPVDVLVVDGVDRRTSSALLRLLDSTRAGLVLVEGGTRPRLSNPLSHGAARAAAVYGRVVPAAPEPWRTSEIHRRGPAVPETGPTSGRQAVEALLDRWERAGRRPLLVALGPDEVQALNLAVSGGRAPGHWQPGDRVVVLRGGRGLPAYGTAGTVLASGPGGRASVAWHGVGTGELAPEDRRRVGFGWAVTPPTARRRQGPQLVLGPSAGRGRDPTPALERPTIEERAVGAPTRRRERDGPGLGIGL
jgi:conjugative relaxase-like TrwC/TraI family protein